VNPARNNTGDCVIRACAVALNKTWIQVSDEIYELSKKYFLSMSDDHLWGRYLYNQGFVPFLLPESCPSCVTIKRFCTMYPHGIYIIGTGSHAVAVIDGNYYDSWDSGDEIPSFFWRIK
jgi:hypothetical protein